MAYADLSSISPILGLLGNIGYNSQVSGGLPGQQQVPQSSGSAWKNFFLGAPGREMKFQRFTPEQQTALSGLLQGSLAGLSQNNFSFAPLEQKARQDFAQKTIPSLAERFTSMGGQRSSAFPQQLGQAGANLETNLAALGSQHGMQQQNMLMNLLRLGLQPQFESAYFPRQQGFLESGAQSLLQILPSLLF